MSITCLVLDCDGIILESMDIKTQAICAVAAKYGQEAVDRLRMHHLMNGGVNRRLKFIWFFEEVLQQSYTDADIDVLEEHFKEMTLEAIRVCPLVPGIKEVLDTWHTKLPIYVCSGAPHHELNTILTQRGLDHYFTGIYGSPPAKSGLLQQIITLAKVDPQDALMVGDAYTDLHAAEDVGTQFYGRGDIFADGKWPYAQDLQQLNAWIKERVTL